MTERGSVTRSRFASQNTFGASGGVWTPERAAAHRAALHHLKAELQTRMVSRRDPFIAILIILVLAFFSGVETDSQAAPAREPRTIICPRSASRMERLAARELRRYVFLRTNRLLPIEQRDNSPTGSAIIVATGNSSLAQSLAKKLQIIPPALETEQYWLKSARLPDGDIALVIGGDDLGTLYGAYRLAEHLGVRFYLHGDVVPDGRVPLEIPMLDETGKPLFRLRGIQPFHDFPEGPDWWNRDDYLAILSQMPKLRMNFFGLHTYPEGGPNAEPTVWIGPSTEISEGESLKSAYPASYQNTARDNWGYLPKKTGRFSCGAAMLFERDDFGPEIMFGAMPEPESPNASNQIFERTGEMFREAFAEAHRLGVKTCVGTETPLTVPRQLAERLRAGGKDPKDYAVIEELYEGIFRRVAQAYPIDFYWFWTPEGWTWDGTKPEQVAATTNDFAAAIQAWKKVEPAFALATCGWVLGPQQDRALFDRVLPKNVAISCINRQVGHTPIEPGFAQVQGRSKWAIPWLEDDGGLSAPELWAARMRRDAFDALRYGCDGLMGIHWRTRVLGPAVSALAQAAWSQDGWSTAWHPDPPSDSKFPPINDFYEDWAEYQFGHEAAAEAAAIFSRIDGHLPRPAEWVDGPGGIRPDPRSWDEVGKQYAFVDELAAVEPRIRGAGNRERFEYWLNTFKYVRQMGRVKCTWARLTNSLAVAQFATEVADRSRLAREEALPIRRELVAQVDKLYDCLLATVSNTGELGTIANWEQHNFPDLLDKPGKQLEALLGEELPADAQLSKTYHGPTRIIVPTVRTSIHRGETLSLKVLVLAEQTPRELSLCWRKMGQGRFARSEVQHVARGVYRAEFPPKATAGDDLEYYIEVTPAKGKPVLWPATAPEQSQTLVAMEP